MRFGDRHFEIAQTTRRYRDAGHHQADGVPDYVGVPALCEPCLRLVGRPDAVRVVGLEALQAQEIVGEGVGFRRDHGFGRARARSISIINRGEGKGGGRV